MNQNTDQNKREHSAGEIKLACQIASSLFGMLKAMYGPLPEIQFCPTGGIDASNFIDFLSLPNVVCAGGSWVCPPDAIQNHDWDR